MESPPFEQEVIDDNLSYLLYESQLSSDDVQSVTSHLLTTSAGFMKITLPREQNAKEFFVSFGAKKRYFKTKDPNHYTPDGKGHVSTRKARVTPSG